MDSNNGGGAAWAAGLGAIGAGLLYNLVQEPDKQGKTKEEVEKEMTDKLMGTGVAAALGAGAGLLLHSMFKEEPDQTKDVCSRPSVDQTSRAGVLAAVSQFIEDQTYLYHYTSEDSAEVILKERCIAMSRSKIADAFSGDGVYLTTMSPQEGKSRILLNNYDGSIRTVGKRLRAPLGQRVNRYFRFRKCDLTGVVRTPLKRNVWLYPSDIDLEKFKWDLGETDGEMIMEFDFIANTKLPAAFSF